MAQLCVAAGITQKKIGDDFCIIFCPWTKSVVLLELKFVFFYSDGEIVFDHVVMRQDEEKGYELLRGAVKQLAIDFLKSCPDWEREFYAADREEKKRIVETMA